MSLLDEICWRGQAASGASLPKAKIVTKLVAFLLWAMCSQKKLLYDNSYSNLAHLFG